MLWLTYEQCNAMLELGLEQEQALGLTDAHIEYRLCVGHTGVESRVGLQSGVWKAFERLREAAAAEGIDLLIASAYRGFERQSDIWNAKARGERPILDNDGEPLQADNLNPADLCLAILRWSALPGASRHHWGTDLDVYDGASIDKDYQLQLTAAEFHTEGPFAKLNHWLAGRIAANNCGGFFRPYAVDAGGIAVEPWHLSFAEEASKLQAQCSEQLLRECLQQVELELATSIDEQLARIYPRFIRVNESLYAHLLSHPIFSKDM